ncbi:MAG: hypothetical protein E6G22_08765 [Actinobacteria bacterium]|nr:MAG: hypothetical protein E6G22_08765 [Actinomycetota bacterium]
MRYPRIRGGLVVRSVSLVFGLLLYAAAIVLMLESRLGLSPWDVLHQGIARHTPFTFGLASVVGGVGYSWSRGRSAAGRGSGRSRMRR